MSEHALLRDLILIYALGLVFILGLARLRVPPLVALIAAGAAAGPAGIGIVRTAEDVNRFAEIGVVLLLFTVGLDFSIARVRQAWRSILGAGTMQVVGTTVAVWLLLMFAGGMPARNAMFVGVFVALSSTAIVLKELSERNQIDSPHGRLVIGILLLQDLCIVVFLLFVPILSGQTPPAAALPVVLRALGALAIVALVSRLALPALLRLVLASRRREAFPLAVLLASIGTAWFSSVLGVSMALGAFLGGLVLAESEFSHQAHAEVRPLRDILAGLFFISLGMLADFSFVVRHMPSIVGVTALIVLLKATVAAGAMLVAAVPLRIAITGAMGLAQVGEFSFILGHAGLEVGLLTPSVWQTLLAASIVTMVLTPPLVANAPLLGSKLAGERRAGIGKREIGIPELSDHVVILGFGVGGRLFAQALRDVGVPYLVLDLNGASVRQARAGGEPIFYGDATHLDTLKAAGTERARAVVAVLSDPHASLRAVRMIRALAPTVPVIVRTRYRSEAEEMERAGATFAVAEELEASLEVLAQLFARLDVPGNLIETLLDGFRRDTAIRRRLRAPSQPLDAMSAIGQLPIATHQLRDSDWSIGRTVADVNLRAETGASILAVRSGSRYVPSPPTDVRLQHGDVIYLVGDEDTVQLARRRLTQGPSDGGEKG